MKRFPRLLIFSVVLLTISGMLFTSLPRPVGATAAKRKVATKAKPSVRAQDDAKPPTPIVTQAVGFAATIPLRDMEVPTSRTKSHRFGKAELNTERPEKITRRSTNVEGDYDATLGQDAQSASEIQPNLLTVPQTNFEGLSNLDNAANPAIGGFVFPPDTVGDVGPNHYVQATNLLFAVYSKTGTLLTPKRPISALFAAMGGRCATTDSGDPIVLYDSFADRWIVTQFLVEGPTPFGQCFAISQTPDPTGAYYTYDFVYPVNKFNDYPKFGVWPDGYYFTANQFNFAGTAFLGVGVGAFDRAKVMAGDPTAGQIFFDLQSSFPNAASMLPSDADGLVPPPANAPNIMSYFAANEFGDPEGDALVFFAFDANFANPGASTFTSQGFVPVAAFDPRSPSGLDDVEQPAPAAANASLDSLSDRLMNRLQYRRVGADEVLTVNHTVNAGTPGNPPTQAQYRAGVRYYELRRPGSGNFTIRNQQTYAPAADTHERWMASAATDNQGNLAIGYSIANGSVATPLFPGIRYAGRLVNDPANTLPQTEQTLQVGTGVQSNAGSRWGDYSALNVDPNDDCTFFYTQEYYQTTTATNVPPFGVNWQTRVGSFRFTECTAPSKGSLVVNVTNCETGLPIQGASVTIDGNLFGSTLANGSFTGMLAPGTYTVTVSGPGFLAPVTQMVTITNGGTATINVCLQGVPAPVATGATLVQESCQPANNAVDPGERVSVNLAVTNNGTDDTTNLVGTLQASANVIAPSGSQNYGNIAPSGTASRTYSFTANGSCGDTITLTLQLQDAVSGSSTVTYTLPLGALVTSQALNENFDSVTPPALPPGFTSDAQGGANPWITTSMFSHTPSNSAANSSIAVVGVTNLNSPTIAIPASSGAGSGAQLTFRNFYNVETGFDGGVLEISINGGAFQDIIAAGGSFVAGGYTGTLPPVAAFGNPLGGRMAWTGNSGGFITSTVNLPASANGQSVQFRWRTGYDNSVTVTNGGQRIDTISLTSATRVCNTSCSIARLITTTTLARGAGNNVVASVTVQNQGVVAAAAVTLTQVRLGTINGTPVPQSLGNLAPGQSATSTPITFPGTSGLPAGSTQLLRVRGTYDGGSSFGSTRNVTLP